MPRQTRIDYPGLLYHIMGRGIERSKIFKEDTSKREFLRRLRMLLNKNSMYCYAWCLMDNHYHLLLQTGQTSLSEFMRRLLTGYAIYYNKTHNRAGHLFQNRYKSIVCNKDEYLLSLIRYIHLNPVRAKTINIEDLEKYNWTGHNEILRQTKDEIIKREEVLAYFGKKEKHAKVEYSKFVKEGLNLKEDYSGGGLIRSSGGLKELIKRKKDEREYYDERILGQGEFVKEVLKKIGEKEKTQRKIKDLNDLIERISKYYNVDKKEIINSRTREVREARSVLVFLANEYLDKSVTEMGKILKITQEAASIAKRRGKELSNIEKIIQ